MASTVLTGPRNPSYTNNTGQNVRIIINYMSSASAATAGPREGDFTVTDSITLTWAGVSASASNTFSGTNNTSIRNPSFFTSGVRGPIIIGKSLGTFATTDSGGVISNGAISPQPSIALPLEILLAPNERFSAVCGVYNIIVIPENG